MTVIVEPSQVTPAWLTAVLRQGGALPVGQVVTVIPGVPDDAALSRICQLQVAYSRETPASDQHRLLLKLARPDQAPDSLGFAGRSMAQLREQEVRFYREVAPRMPEVPLVRCYDAFYDPQLGTAHLLLEDLTVTHASAPPGDPPPAPWCTQAVEALAGLHARWWDDPALGTTLIPFPDPASVAAGVVRTQQAIEGFLEYLGNQLPAARRRLYQRLHAFLPKHAARLGAGPATLIHRDAHWRNILYPRDPRDPAMATACLFDWQSWGAGAAVVDLAYLLAWYWSPDARRPRRALATGLVRRYHRRLTHLGVRGYSWPQCWNDFRLAVLRAPCGPATAWSNRGLPGEPPGRWLAGVEKALVLFDALQCTELLEP